MEYRFTKTVSLSVLLLTLLLSIAFFFTNCCLNGSLFFDHFSLVNSVLLFVVLMLSWMVFGLLWFLRNKNKIISKKSIYNMREMIWMIITSYIALILERTYRFVRPAARQFACLFFGSKSRTYLNSNTLLSSNAVFFHIDTPVLSREKMPFIARLSIFMKSFPLRFSLWSLTYSGQFLLCVMIVIFWNVVFAQPAQCGICFSREPSLPEAIQSSLNDENLRETYAKLQKQSKIIEEQLKRIVDENPETFSKELSKQESVDFLVDKSKELAKKENTLSYFPFNKININDVYFRLANDLSADTSYLGKVAFFCLNSSADGSNPHAPENFGKGLCAATFALVANSLHIRLAIAIMQSAGVGVKAGALVAAPALAPSVIILIQVAACVALGTAVFAKLMEQEPIALKLYYNRVDRLEAARKSSASSAESGGSSDPMLTSTPRGGGSRQATISEETTQTLQITADTPIIEPEIQRQYDESAVAVAPVNPSQPPSPREDSLSAINIPLGKYGQDQGGSGFGSASSSSAIVEGSSGSPFKLLDTSSAIAPGEVSSLISVESVFSDIVKSLYEIDPSGFFFVFGATFLFGFHFIFRFYRKLFMLSLIEPYISAMKEQAIQQFCSFFATLPYDVISFSSLSVDSAHLLSAENHVRLLIIIGSLLVGSIYYCVQYMVRSPLADYRWLLSKPWIRSSSIKSTLESSMKNIEEKKQQYIDFGYVFIFFSCILLWLIFGVIYILIFLP